MYRNIVVIGSSGAIGSAFTRKIAELYPKANVHAFCRQKTNKENGNVTERMMDYLSEESVHEAANIVSSEEPIDLAFIATGLLHEGDMYPEKSLRDISIANFNKIFSVNTIVPAVIAKHFIPKLNRHKRCVFATLSARVGSISDNRLGGWYAYRASKAALNMIIKTAALEVTRMNKNAIVVGLHPGTVDSTLSKPFQHNVENKKLFSPDYSVSCLINTIERLTLEHSGRCFAWDGKEILP
ncbi:SDR family NAD(P)-dependent oxidoreductase [Vibrio marisflavi]|uniref:Short-chain dehydrogenase n=1 Tax=Vibrio marisflavi CECT 7928 TaxID=634439 RepID=A0ABN8E2L8_9VIBR|nr:SDR family NAD(P)-dependent oxidoreductase [Vibrio marisflavi]CAH0536625.1 hypothetical protein VMF7928_00580 [Vibrio marisflavi CECT 7928]